MASQHWWNLRADRRALCGNKCEECGTGRKLLEGHHVVYRIPLTACTVEDIRMLCVRCHVELHRKRNKERHPKKNVVRAEVKAFIADRAARRRELVELCNPYHRTPSRENLGLVIANLQKLLASMP